MNPITAESTRYMSGDDQSLQREDGFDPMANLFVAQSRRPGSIEEINLRALSPFQRALLVIDGTVTKFIEAFTMEPIEIVRLTQDRSLLVEDHPWLEARAGIEIITRQVLLRGRYSHTLHAHAASIIVPGRVPAEVERGLSDSGDGIGQLLLGSRLETRREVLWYGKEDVSELPSVLRQQGDDNCLSRTYRIIFQERPVMLINERFFSQVDRNPSHT